MENLKWYVLQSHPRQEGLLENHVTAMGYECYYPVLHVYPVNPRSHKFVSYFPGYIFVRADLKAVGDSVFKWMPYSIGLVSFGGEPASIHESIVQAIQAHLSKLNSAEPDIKESLKPGDRVEIQSGLLKGHEGIFDRHLSGKQRGRILISILGQEQTIPITVNVDQIRPKDQK